MQVLKELVLKEVVLKEVVLNRSNTAFQQKLTCGALPNAISLRYSCFQVESGASEHSFDI